VDPSSGCFRCRRSCAARVLIPGQCLAGAGARSACRLGDLVLLGSATGLALVTAIQGPSAASTQVLVDMLIVPVGTALAALVLFVLVGAVFRMLRVRRDAASLLFLAVAVIVLLVSTPLVGWEWLAQPLRDWFLNVLSLAGMRGLVLGVALGTVITALRALLLGDWPRERRNVGGK